MNDEIKKALWEAGKEAGRVAIFAVVSWGLAKLTSLPQTDTVLLGTLVLRTVDKFLHAWAKEQPVKTQNEGWLGVLGLTAF